LGGGIKEKIANNVAKTDMVTYKKLKQEIQALFHDQRMKKIYSKKPKRNREGIRKSYWHL
jgi:flagellar basal body rod protein FlgG